MSPGMPFSSAMPEVSALSSSPAWAVSLTAGAPVGLLVRLSAKRSASVKLTRTLTILPTSAPVSV